MRPPVTSRAFRAAWHHGLTITVLCSLLSLAASGCERQPVPREPDEAALFTATSMRIHPIFTQVKDWTADEKPDGIEALLEFADRFGDPTKATGKVVFELFDYRKNYPDPRGDRVGGPWIGSMQSLEEQQAHWNRTSRTYSFRLTLPTINPKHTYVLTAIFEHSAGGRFFDRTILAGQTDPGDRTGRRDKGKAGKLPGGQPTNAAPQQALPVTPSGKPAKPASPTSQESSGEPTQPGLSAEPTGADDGPHIPPGGRTPEP